MDLANAPDLPKKAHKAAADASGPAARVLQAEDIREPEFLRMWEALAEDASEPNPFFEPWFLLPSLSAFGQFSETPFLFAHYTDGTLTGLAPLARNRQYYGHPIPHRSVWLHTNAFYGAPLVAQGHEHAFWHAMLDHLDRNAGTALFAHVPLLDVEGPLNQALDDVVQASGRANSTVINRERAMLASSLAPQDYLENALSKKHRKELRRQRRRLEELGEVTLEQRNDDFGLEEWIAEFLALEAAGWKGDAGSALASNNSAKQFFSQTLEGAARAGKLERIAMRLDGKPVAMLSSFVTLPGAYSFKTAFDERFAAHSPGLQLQIENLSLLERSEIQWTDSCAAEGHPMIDRLWTERRKLVSRNVAIGGRVRRAIFDKLTAYETRRRSET